MNIYEQRNVQMPWSKIKKKSLAVKVGNKNINELTEMSIVQ